MLFATRAVEAKTITLRPYAAHARASAAIVLGKILEAPRVIGEIAVWRNPRGGIGPMPRGGLGGPGGRGHSPPPCRAGWQAIEARSPSRIDIWRELPLHGLRVAVSALGIAAAMRKPAIPAVIRRSTLGYRHNLINLCPHWVWNAAGALCTGATWPMLAGNVGQRLVNREAAQPAGVLFALDEGDDLVAQRAVGSAWVVGRQCRLPLPSLDCRPSTRLQECQNDY